jgi:hypothetical protein
VEYRIDRAALVAFVARQVDLVEATELPSLLGEVVELRLRHDDVSREEVRALWLGAGLAPHVGQDTPPILAEPARSRNCDLSPKPVPKVHAACAVPCA